MERNQDIFGGYTENVTPDMNFFHVFWLVSALLVFLPPASAVEVIESELSFCVSVCEHSHGGTVWPTTLIFDMIVGLDFS